MSSIQELQDLATTFRNERDWKQFHNFKDMLLSLGLEVSEFGELFQWKSDKEVLATSNEALGEEMADVLYWLLLFSEDLGIDLASTFKAKMKKNEIKYPIDKSRGRKDKYSNL